MTTTDKDKLPTMTIKEFASYAKIGINSVHKLCNIEGFPRLRIGKKNLIFWREAVAWLRENSDHPNL